MTLTFSLVISYEERSAKKGLYRLKKLFEYIAFLKKIILLPHKRVNNTLKYLIVHTRRVSFPNAGAWLPTPVVKKATTTTTTKNGDGL